MDSESRSYRRCELAENVELGGGNYILRFGGCDFLRAATPGQFVMLRALDWGTDPLLPRAFSLLSVSADGVADILVKAAGKASRLLERVLPGSAFGILGPLGHGFEDPAAGREQWLIAGGVGFAPLYMVALRANELGRQADTTMFYGGRGAIDLVCLDRLDATGVRCVFATEDGSRGTRGYVTEPLNAALDARDGAARPPVLLACGPDPMLEAVASLAHRRKLECFLSLEGEMACGIGACLVCAVPCRGEKPYQYACVQGPVFDLAELQGRYAEAEGRA